MTILSAQTLHITVAVDILEKAVPKTDPALSQRGPEVEEPTLNVPVRSSYGGVARPDASFD